MSLKISLEVGPHQVPVVITGQLVGDNIVIPFSQFTAAIASAHHNGGADVIVERGNNRKVYERTPPTKRSERRHPVRSKAQGGNASPVQDAIRALLERLGAVTMSEMKADVVASAGSTPEGVASAVYLMKKRGVIEQFDDEKNGGLTKWRLRN